jgi:hypothetical protein
MILWLHMFSWVVLNVPIKSVFLYYPKAMIIKHKAFFRETILSNPG